jgi:hypothetical protein
MRSRVVLLVVVLLLSLRIPDAETAEIATDRPSGDAARTARVAILVDACIERDDAGRSAYYVTEPSLVAASRMGEAMSKLVNKKIYHISSTLYPFVGGFLDGDEESDVAPNPGDRRLKARPPFYASPEIAGDKDYASALAAVLREVEKPKTSRDLSSIYDAGEPPHQHGRQGPDWGLLHDRLRADYLLVATMSAVSVSGEKQWGTYCFSSCLSIGVSALLDGICSAATHSDQSGAFDVDMTSEGPPSKMKSVVVLFRTEDGKVMWRSVKSHTDMDPMSEGFYTTTWAPDLMGDRMSIKWDVGRRKPARGR